MPDLSCPTSGPTPLAAEL